MNNVASVKDRLKNKSIATGKTVQELLTAYGLERTMFRLSKSQYASNFTLKGESSCTLFSMGITRGQPRILICWRKRSVMTLKT